MPHVAQTLEVEEGKKKSGRYNFISFKKKNRLGGVVRGEVWVERVRWRVRVRERRCC